MKAKSKRRKVHVIRASELEKWLAALPHNDYTNFIALVNLPKGQMVLDAMEDCEYKRMGLVALQILRIAASLSFDIVGSMEEPIGGIGEKVPHTVNGVKTP